MDQVWAKRRYRIRKRNALSAKVGQPTLDESLETLGVDATERQCRPTMQQPTTKTMHKAARSTHGSPISGFREIARATKHRLVIPIRKRCKRCECPPTAGTSEKRRPTPVRGDSLQHSAAERRRPWRGIDAEHAVAAGANCRRRGLLDAAVCRDAVHHDHRKPRSGPVIAGVPCPCS